MKLLLLSRELMLNSRVEGVARQCGLSMASISEPSQATEKCDEECVAVVVDLQMPGLDLAGLVESLRAVPDAKPVLVACGPHVHEQKLEAAKQAGFDRVVTRGQFDRDALAIVQQAVASAGAD